MLDQQQVLLKAEEHKHSENLKKCDNDISRRFEQVRHIMKEYLIKDKYQQNERDLSL